MPIKAISVCLEVITRSGEFYIHAGQTKIGALILKEIMPSLFRLPEAVSSAMLTFYLVFSFS
jgi:hypothetical protein